MLRLAASILLLLVLQTAFTARVAEAHIPPPAFFTMTITDDKTEVHLAALFSVFQDWFELDPAEIPADGSIDATQQATLETTLAKLMHVQIDGLPAVVTSHEIKTERFEDHEEIWDYVNLHVVYATQVPPQQVAVAWTRYSADGAKYVFDEIDVEIDAYGESNFPVLRKREPEFIWHRPREIAKPAPPVLPRPSKQPHFTLPLVSVAILMTLLGVAFVRRKHLTLGRFALALGVAAISASQLMHLARVDVPLPGTTGLQRPPDKEALVIFASLHRGVYDALDGETEDEIYDVLDENVTGELLPTLYLDIHESLILQNQGGAVAKIQKTEIVEASIVPGGESEVPWFKVRSRWRIEGKVGHWGHTHQRINEYLANVTILAVEGRWKIAEVEVLDQQRIDDGKQVK